MKTGIIIQARMGSTRLPGKTYKEVLGRPLLGFLIERLKRVKGSPTLILATTTKSNDDLLVTFASGQNIASFRGSENNVLERFYLAAKAQNLDLVVRITADCPLMDPQIIDMVLECYQSENPPPDYVSNTIERTFPRGMDVEVFSFKALETAYRNAQSPAELEHVTPYIYSHPDKFRIKQFKAKENHSHYRWTVDTPEDFIVIENLIRAAYPQNRNFTLDDLLNHYHQNPEWAKINEAIKQKE